MRTNGMSKEFVKACDALTRELLRKRKVSCNMGGCDNHSGHEVCSLDAAYENYFEEARDKLSCEYCPEMWTDEHKCAGTAADEREQRRYSHE